MKCRRILAALLAIAFALPFGAAQAGETYAKVRCAGAERQLCMRISPDGQSAVMARYYDGVRVTVLCDYGEWLLVSPGETDIGTPGYMNRGSLVFEGEKEYDAITEAAPWFMSAEPVWALYEDPAEEAEYALYGRGEAMLLLGETTSGWWHVRVLRGADGETYSEGYVPAGALRETLTAVVNNPNPADRLNLRREWNRTAQSLGKYYNGVRVNVLGMPGGEEQPEWALVEIEGTGVRGYMKTAYLAFDEEAGAVQSAQPQRTLKESVGLKEKAAQGAAEIQTLPVGTVVRVLGVCGEWLHVCAEGAYGYLPESAAE